MHQEICAYKQLKGILGVRGSSTKIGHGFDAADSFRTP